MKSVKIFNACLLQKNKITEDQMIMNRTALCQKIMIKISSTSVNIECNLTAL